MKNWVIIPAGLVVVLGFAEIQMLGRVLRGSAKRAFGAGRRQGGLSGALAARFRQFDGDDEATFHFVMSENAKRRHLTNDQSTMIGAEVLPIYEEFAKGERRKVRSEEPKLLERVGQ